MFVEVVKGEGAVAVVVVLVGNGQTVLPSTAMPRVSIVPLVSDIRSCWTSRVNRVEACLPCRVRHAVSKSRVCRVKEIDALFPREY